jgi:histone-lysine N-methyltransferase SETMAR
LTTQPWRLLLSNPWTRRHQWDQLWSLPGDLNSKFELVLQCCKVCSLTLDKWSKAVVHKHVSWAQEKANEDPTFVSKIITGDESSIYGYEPETKQQSLQWKSPQSPKAKKARQVWRWTNSMYTVFLFLTWRGLFNVNLFLLTLWSTQTFTGIWYTWEKMCNKKDRNFGATTTGSFIMMCPPTSLKTTEFVTNNNMVIVPRPPYSPDLAPRDCTFFPKLKIKPKGWHFETVSNIQRESQAELDSIKKNYVHSAFEAWEKWWDRGIHCQGDYFEGDGSQNWVS